MSIGTDVVALKQRLAEVEQGRRNAEEVLRVASERNAELLARAEQAERERDKALRAATEAHDLATERMGLVHQEKAARECAEAEASEARRAAEMQQGRAQAAEKRAVEADMRAARAEADNAALLMRVREAIEAQCPEDASDALHLAQDGAHPGAATLERMRALEKVRDEAVTTLSWHENGVWSTSGAEATRKALSDAIAKADALKGGGQ